MRLSSFLTPGRITDVFITSDQQGALLLRKRNDDNIFRINPSAAYIWQLCDGSTNIGQITESIKQLYSATIEVPEKEVSDSIAELLSTGLLEFRKIKVKPFAKIAFSNYSGELSSLHLSFIHLLGTWFDLKVVKRNEDPDIYIHFGHQGRSEIKASLCIFISEQGEPPEDEFDFIFTSSLDTRIAPEINIVLPECHMSGEYSALSPDDWKKMTAVLGEPETDQKNVPPAGIKQHDKRDKTKKLTIGMATYDDYDGVYFSVQSIRMYHPEVTDETEILVIDNNPSGPCAEDLRNLASSIPGYRYMAVDEVRGTAVRDFVFREAKTEYVMCIDSHVFLVPGAIRKLIDYFDGHPDTPDLLQGPLVNDDLESISTHFEPAWQQGMFGFWSVGEHGKKITDEPFDIQMQGLGLAACRKDAWLGYNSRFRGFGGEEGYIHQKFRNAGARTLCLPFLRWMHRFSRPMGTNYPNVWEERIRNYLIGFKEVGLDIELLKQHFCQMTSKKVVEEVIQQIKNEENNPFSFFDAIYCINLDAETGRWQEMGTRLKSLGILQRVVRLSAVETAESHHIGCALSHRKAIERARQFGYKNVLVLEDDAKFHVDALMHLTNALSELNDIDWNAFYLGGMKWGEKHGEPYKKIIGCNYLDQPKFLTCTHAIAYNKKFFDIILDELPDDPEVMKTWLTKHVAIDQYLTKVDKTVLICPAISTQENIQNFEDESMRRDFH